MSVEERILSILFNGPKWYDPRELRCIAMDVRKLEDRIKQLESDAISAKWMWMMNYCKTHGFSPTLGWESAEKAWTAAFEAKEAKP